MVAIREPWQMTRKEFNREKRLRARCRKEVVEDQAERQRIAKETGFPVGHAYDLIDALADAPPLEGINHKAAVAVALILGKPVPDKVRQEYDL